MNTTTTKFLTVLGALALGSAYWVPAASAQNHVVAIGQVGSGGSLENSANTVGGVVASTQNGTGDYTVTVTAPGTFTGTATDDFVAEVTCEDSSSNDRIAKVDVASVTANVLTLDVHTDDVEDSSNLNIADSRNNAFFFSIYRIPGSFAGKGDTKFLLSTGKVDFDGNLLSGLRLEGLVVSSTNLGAGDYEVTFTNPGAFAGMGVDDFVPILSLNANVSRDEAIRGDVTSVNANTVTLRVLTDEVQDDTVTDDDTPWAMNTPFYYTLYQIPSGSSSGPAKSQALVSLGSVDNAGNLVSGGTFGGSVSSVRNSEGNFTVTIVSPGAFAGRSSDEFAAQVHLHQGISADETIDADLTVANPNALTLSVRISDVEEGTTILGDPQDWPFHFLVYDAVADQRPDLQIGKRRSLTKHKGDGKYNNSGAGQTIRVKLRDRKNGKPRKKKYFFVAENDGNVVDNLRLRGTRSGKQIKTKYFRIDDGRQNVTAALRTGNLTLDELFPGEQARFRGVAKFKKNAKRKRKKIAYRTRSLHDAAKRDAAKVILKRKKRN